MPKRLLQIRSERESLLSKTDMVNNTRHLVAAGSETWTMLLSERTWLLLKYQVFYQRLVDYVRSSFEHEDDIDLISMGRLGYMLAILDGASQWYQPVHSYRLPCSAYRTRSLTDPMQPYKTTDKSALTEVPSPANRFLATPRWHYSKRSLPQ